MQRLALGTQASEEQAIVTTKKDYDAAKYGGWKSAKMLFTEVPEKPQIVGRWDWHVVQFLLALVPPGLVLLLVQWARRDMAHMSQRIQGPERQQREQAAACHSGWPRSKRSWQHCWRGRSSGWRSGLTSGQRPRSVQGWQRLQREPQQAPLQAAAAMAPLLAARRRWQWIAAQRSKRSSSGSAPAACRGWCSTQ